MKTAAAILGVALIASAAEGWEIRCPDAPERKVPAFSSPFLAGGWNAAVGYHDTETLGRMERQGVVARVAAGTPAYPLGEASGDTRQVRIQEGSLQGKTVYVPRSCLVNQSPTPRATPDEDYRLPDSACQRPPCWK